MHKHAHTRAASSLKARIEHISGLSLADAVNVAIFVLTVVSLFLAGVGVLVAVLTLSDAHKSGTEQEHILEGQRQSLEKLQAQLSQNVDLTKGQLDILRQNIEVAKGQLNVLQAQNKREIKKASEKPLVKLNIVCFSKGTEPVFATDLTGQENEKEQVFRLDVTDESMLCSFALSNTGTATLQDGYLKIKMFGSGKGTGADGLKFVQVDPSQPRRASDPWEDSFDYMDVVKNYPLFAKKKRGDAPMWQWQLIVPSYKEVVTIGYEFGGSNYPVEKSTIRILTKAVEGH